MRIPSWSEPTQFQRYVIVSHQMHLVAQPLSALVHLAPWRLASVQLKLPEEWRCSKGASVAHLAAERCKLQKQLKLLHSSFFAVIAETYNVELAIKNQGAIIIFQVHHHDFRGKQILITFSKALIKFAIDMLYYHFFWPKTPSRNNKLLQKPSRNKKNLFWARNF